MTQYLNLQTQQLTTESQIRSDNPNTSYPQPFPVPDGYALVFDAPQPTYDQYSETITQTTPILTDKGHYEQQWVVTPLADEALTQAQERKVQDEQQSAINEQNAQIAKIESDFKEFLDLKNIDSIGEASALLNSTNATWQNEAAHAIELWDLTWQAFYNDEPLPVLVWE
jgi:hypothetical protein